jgi:hypothetical protein
MNNIAIKLNLGTWVGRAGNPLPAAAANQRLLIYPDGAHGVTRPTGPKVAKSGYPLGIVRLSAGARASARFNVHGGAALEMSTPLPIRALKRRERRAPPAPNVGHPIFPFPIL